MIRHFMNVNVYSIKIFIIIFIFHIVAVPTYGVVNRFTHLTIQDGLSQSTVTSIFQDSSGFLWFGTENGLNRYDGSIFKKYLTSFRDSSSLTDPGVNAIVEDYK
ncbi:MAG: two-component regulator propeller domain-containing protein, partial [Bacteroidaceae bacterium]